MKGKSLYGEIFDRRKAAKLQVVYKYFEPRKFIDEKFKFDKKVLDFGCAIESDNYKKTLKDGGSYYGFDLDQKTVEWLKKENLFIDFWNTQEKFDTIVASQVYEHLDHESREQFIERCHKLLNLKGMLIIDFPYVKNIGGLTYWEDRTHLFPPDAVDDSHLAELYSFESEVYLVGISYFPPHYFFRVLLNILLGFYPHHTAILACKKK